MKIKDVAEWIRFADDNFYSAQILNKSLRKPIEIICYNCAQSAEKYLKGFLISHDLIPEKTHNLVLLNDLCIKIDNNFKDIEKECFILNKFSVAIRYPHEIKVTDKDVDYSLNAIEKIKDFEPIKGLINIAEKENKKREQEKER